MRVDCNIQQEIEQRRVELHELAGKHGRIDSIIILKSKQLDDLLSIFDKCCLLREQSNCKMRNLANDAK
jgi:hypothetical protein